MTPNATPTILLVEDNLDDIELARRMFEKCGVLDRVIILQDGQSALDYAGANAKALKLVLLDLNLPVVPGAAVLEKLRSDPGTKHIAIVALTITGREKEALEKGPHRVDGYLRKPLELHSFLNLTKTYLQ